ncbi:hypothetical protein CRUP_028649 [Coryphaenoides rupestris]|nr:hypothetical protein CRUP_028649 [Coryphaenoides rupestris]
MLLINNNNNNNAKKAAASVGFAACVSLLVVLLVAAQHHRLRVTREDDAPRGDLATRSLHGPEELQRDPETTRPQAQVQTQVQVQQDKKGFSAYFTKLTRGRRDADKQGSGWSGSARPEPPPVEDISAGDLFIAVKTTKKFHQSRLRLLLDTWISRNLAQGGGSQSGTTLRSVVVVVVVVVTYIFTDGEDEELKQKIGEFVCHDALSCKMAVEYDKFIESGKKWFCHVDDDNYVNVRTLVKLLSQYPHTQDMYLGKPSLDRPHRGPPRDWATTRWPVNFWFRHRGRWVLREPRSGAEDEPWASGGHFMNMAEKIRLPDDCTVGYIVEAVLGQPFHSHLENLLQVPRSEIHKQITLSYGMFENKRNIINMKGAFPVEGGPVQVQVAF